MENINNARDSLDRFLSKYSTRQKVIGATSILGIILLIVLVIMALTRPTYVPLYSELDLQTMSGVKTALDDMQVDYKIQGQNSIYVREQDKSKIMIDLAGQDIPAAKFNYNDLIGMNSMFMSDDEKTTARNYALQNAISTVLEGIEGVENAQVTLTIPKTSNFILQENVQVPKASVLVGTAPGAELSKESIDGIVSLVTNSVEGLISENVTVVSANGQILNKTEEENELEGMTDNMVLQQKIEKDISESVHKFLTPMVGFENVSVMASVKLNFDTNKTQSEVFSPPVEGEIQGMKRSEQNLSEIVENRPNAIGAPGMNANDAQQQVTDYITVDENRDSYYRRDESTINYEMNRIVNEVEKAKGQIQDITVSVILNKDSLVGGELTEEKRQQIVDLITAATGIDTRAVEVYAESFNKPFDAAANSDGEGVGNLPIPAWMWVLIAITALIPIIALAIYALNRRRQRQEEQRIREEEERRRLEEQMAIKYEEEIKEEIEDIELDIKESSHKKSIEDLIERNPQIVVSLLKTWINEDE